MKTKIIGILVMMLMIGSGFICVNSTTPLTTEEIDLEIGKSLNVMDFPVGAIRGECKVIKLNNYKSNKVPTSISGIDLIQYDAFMSTQPEDPYGNYSIEAPSIGTNVYFYSLFQVFGGTTPECLCVVGVDLDCDGYLEGSEDEPYCYVQDSFTPNEPDEVYYFYCESWSVIEGPVVGNIFAAIVDAYNNVSEDDENNNVITYQWTPTTGGNNPPTAYIDSITPNPAKEGQTVTFSGHGTDSDGTITGYNWRSSKDGQLSTQTSFSTSELSVGTHTIYFKVKDNNDTWSNEVSSNLVVNTPENNPPETPSSPSPTNTATGVDVNDYLSWDGGDPDTDDQVYYKIHFDTSTPPQYRTTIGPFPATQTRITYDPGTMEYDAKYYWQIIASDNHDATKSSSIWQFTTKKGDYYHIITLDPNIPHWDRHSNSSSGNSGSSHYANSGVDYGDTGVFASTSWPQDHQIADASTTHYFQWNAPCDMSNGFAIFVYEMDQLIGHYETTAFTNSWAHVWARHTFFVGDLQETEYYFDDQGEDGQHSHIDYGEAQGNHDLYGLRFKKGQTYNIGVKFEDHAETTFSATAYVTSITRWLPYDDNDISFIEIRWFNRAPETSSNPNPSDGQTGVSTSPTLTWSCSDADGDSLTYDIYFGTDSDPSLVVQDSTANSYTPGSLSEKTLYYWKIVAQDEFRGSTTGSVWSFKTTGDCCFPVGTKITMADGSYKNIEDIKIGEMILSFNEQTQQCEKNRVLKLESPIREGYYELYHNNNLLVKVTNEHPFYTKKPDGSICWSSIQPDITKQYHSYLNNVQKLNLGDQIYCENEKWIEITSWEYITGEIQTYNLKTIENTHTFFANGLLVHNKGGFPAGTKILMGDGTNKNIEDIQKGDVIQSYNRLLNKSYTWTVKMLGTPNEILYDINNGAISTVDAHVFFIKKSDGRVGWGAINPEVAQQHCRLQREILPLKIGDYLFTSNSNWIEIKEITHNDEVTKLYNILSYSGRQTYYANDFYVYEDNAPFYPIWFNYYLDKIIVRFPILGEILQNSIH